MSQFPKSGFLARAATSSAAARASLRSKPSASTVSSLSSSRRTSHSHPNSPTTSTPPPPPAPASPHASQAQSTAATAAAAAADSTAASSQFEVYGPHLPGHSAAYSASASAVAGPSRASTSTALPLPIPASSGPSSSTYVSIGVHVATSSSNVFGPASAPVSSASFASAMTTVAPAARRPFNFWPQAVVTANTVSAPTPTAAGYAAAAAVAAAATHVQTVTSPLIGAQTGSSSSTSSSQSSARPSPADIFLSSLYSDFDPSLPWSTSTPTADWLSSSLASTSIQSSVSWEGRLLAASKAPEATPSSPKRSRAASSAPWSRAPITFDTTTLHGENWSASFSSNFHRTADGSFAEGSGANGSGSRTGSRDQSAKSSSHQHQNQHHQQHQQHQHGRSPPPHPNPYPSNNPPLSSTGALITRPPSSGSSSSSSSTLHTSSVLSQTSAAAASSNTSSAPLNGSGFGAPGGISARSLSIPPQSHTFDRSFNPHFHFQHGAYGIPKRHPLSSMQRTKRRKATDASKGASNGGSSGGAAGFFAAAASSLVGGVSGSSTSKTGSDAAKEVPIATPTFTNAATTAVSTKVGERDSAGAASAESNGNADASAKHGSEAASAPSPPSPEPSRPRGICQDGRIVQDRLRSVPVGEDAYFLREDALGVADGVGGWASRPGADPALFSRLLMHFCSVELSRFDSLSSEELAAKDGAMLRRWAQVDPVEILHCAWHRCVRAARREGIIGSSTALVAVLRGDELRIANVGDCVLLIIRQGDLLFRSTEQQHSFNFPVQLGMMGDTVESVAEELQRRKDVKEKAAAAAAAAAEAGAKEDGVEGSEEGQKSAAKVDSEDADDEPIPDGVDYTIDGHGASTSTEANGPNGSAASVNANGDAQHLDSAGSTNSATANGGGSSANAASNDVDGEESEVEWDEPRRDAGRWSVKVEPGDVIIIGSDGLVDNLFDEDILEEVLRFAPAPAAAASSDSESVSPQAADGQQAEGDQEGSAGGADEHAPFGNWLPADFSPQLVSEALCSRAKAVSEDSRALYSPFQQRAVTEGLHYVGGKHDDISVLVAVVGAHQGGADNEGKLFVSQSLRNHQQSSQGPEPTST
ncbi:unnamed protein product [Tilletia laevis]|uniref:PPM-type phosphatase domain-containing protein n=2 Tax=Tilletia TaxID=13289 RepID=A0A177UQ40_9BASI|nr:hypothetical protein CF336_g2116 [Tilletia laevis]KAE8263149.1 hypothetical protein A4X03_0g1897 [Tilletia caries]KAE8206941.1 hypothetical protein CF335_g1504 [Tilletia laevis]CAD6891012.1 unnamed protein product [Tilletia caries]CAD6896130.1 unnamed protein product [Tilletia laevis]